MKLKNIYRFMYVISIVLIIGFCIKLGGDYIKYNSYNNSAPFYAFVIVRTLEYILPSIIVFSVAKIINKKCNK